MYTRVSYPIYLNSITFLHSCLIESVTRKDLPVSQDSIVINLFSFEASADALSDKQLLH